MYFGFLVPSITKLIIKYENILKANQLKISIELRFEKILNDKFFTTAAISHPYFKTAWLKNK